MKGLIDLRVATASTYLASRARELHERMLGFTMQDWCTYSFGTLGPGI